MPLHSKPRDLLPSHPGVIQHMPQSKPQENFFCVTQSNPHQLFPGTWHSPTGAIQSKLVCPSWGYSTMVQMCYQRDLECHPIMGAGAAQQIGCQRALGLHRRLHTRETQS